MSDYAQLTVKDLVAEIERRNAEGADIPATGNKADLVARLEEDDRLLEAEESEEDAPTEPEADEQLDECVVDNCTDDEFEPGRKLCNYHFTTRLDLREVARNDD
jgi:hypothetical protein